MSMRCEEELCYRFPLDVLRDLHKMIHLPPLSFLKCDLSDAFLSYGALIYKDILLRFAQYYAHRIVIHSNQNILPHQPMSPPESYSEIALLRKLDCYSSFFLC